MYGLHQYLVPYLVSQVVAIILLLIAFRNTRLARLIVAVLFIAASAANMYTGLIKPDSYLDYGWMAVPLYRDFINGWFSHYIQIIVPVIAIGQLLIGVGMLLKGWWVRWACFGAIIFLLSIAPLLVGSAFPFSLIASWAVLLVLKRDKKTYLWQPLASNQTGHSRMNIISQNSSALKKTNKVI
jgi:hypothetical protein